MKIKQNYTLNIYLILSIIILLISCNKEDKFSKSPIGQLEIWNCYHETAWDSLKIQNSLVGEWEYTACFWSIVNNTSNEEYDQSIEFKSDSTLIVKQNGEVIQTSKWTVVDGDAGLYALDIKPSVNQLGGRILICGDIVEFNYSYLDLCDNYFRRKN